MKKLLLYLLLLLIPSLVIAQNVHTVDTAFGTKKANGSNGVVKLGVDTNSIHGGSGGAPLGLNKRGDSLSAVDTVPIFPDPRNTGWTGLNHMRNFQAVMALTQDTIGYSGTSDSAQLRLNLFGNSMFERNYLFEQHYIQYMSSKGFHSVGPGFITMSGQKFGINWVVPVAEWTTLSLFTGTVGTGPDGYELVSTGATGDSIVIQPQTAYKFNDWMQGTVVEIWWRGGSGFGSFRLVIDGTNYGTINTASSAGINRTIIRNLPYTFHVVSIAPVSEGTNHIHLLGMFEYQSGTRGWLVNKVARGSSTVTQWLGLNASEWQTMVGWMKPTTALMDWVVTSMNTSDSTDLVLKMDSIFRRLRVVDSTIDRVVFGPTIFSQGGSYVIISPWASYGRALKRMCQDSLITYWDPSALLGTNVILAMKRAMVDPDSLHRSPTFSEVEVAQILSSIGTLAYIPPPTVANFYAQDGTMTIGAGVREVFMDGANNTNGTSLRFHDLNKFYMLGKGANPGLTWDFSNSLQVALTGGIQIVGDMDIKTSQTFSSTYSSNAKNLYNATLGNAAGVTALNITGGGASATTAYGVFEQVTTPALANQFENLNSTSGYSILVIKSNGTTGPAAIRLQNTTGIFDQLVDPGDSKKYKFYAGNGFSTGTLVFAVNPTTSNTNFGSATDVPTSLFSITSTTKGAIPAPIMTATQMNAISSPATGLMVFNSTAGEYYRYNGSAWAAIGGGLTNPMTTAGDIIVGGSSGTPGRLAIGANGTFPVVSSGALAYTTVLPNGTTATTQAAGSNDTKPATDAYVDGLVSYGAYLPTSPGQTTITSFTIDSSHYTRIGPMISGSISGTLNASTTGIGGAIRFTIPINQTGTVPNSFPGHGAVGNSSINPVILGTVTMTSSSEVTFNFITPLTTSTVPYQFNFFYHLY